MSNEFYWLAVVATTIISAARLTRLMVADKFPPVKWIRDKYSDWTDATEWWWLVNCGYCFSFWATAFVVVWGWLSGAYDGVSGNAPLIWWLVNGTLAASYLAAILMAHDGDDSGDDD